MVSLVEYVLFICADFAFVCVCVACAFTSWVVCKSGILSCEGSLEILLVVALPTFYVSII